MPMLDKEFKYFLDHQKELVDKYPGKYIVIIDEDVVGIYDTEAIAYEESKKKYSEGTFLLQHCLPGNSTYKQTFNSRVAFV